MKDKTEAGAAEIPDSITVPLSKPIEAHGEKVSQIVLREPTLDDLEEAGVELTGVKRIPAVKALTSKLSDIPPSSVGQLKAYDLNALGEAISLFFHGPPETGDS